jgi:PE-PPE domain
VPRGRRTPGAVRPAATGPTLAVLGIATAGAAVIGLTPTLSASPELLATVYYLRGTNIGDEPTDAEYEQFMDRVFNGAGGASPATTKVKIPYNAGFWPVSSGGLDDLTYNASVEQGVDLLNEKPVGTGDTVFGFSQGAVAASKYKGEHQDSGATYVLAENPSRPNGGVMTRFEGLTIPILDITFSGPTPETDDLTIDIARQYDGWADFPTYPLNFLATANAIAGIVYVHGSTQREEDLAADIAGIETDPTDPNYDPMYYQEHGNTEYYLIATDRLPLLMPLEGIVPDPILTAADTPLRYVVELGYERGDYSEPTRAGLAPVLNPITVAQGLTEATVQGVQDGLTEAGVSTAGLTAGRSAATTRALVTEPKLPRLPKLTKSDTRQRITPIVQTDSASPLSAKPKARVGVAGDRPVAKAVASALKSLTPKKPTKPERAAAEDKPEGDKPGD